MRHILQLLLASFFLSLPIASFAQPSQSRSLKERWTRFDHRLRSESPRWPDDRYYEKYTFRAMAGDHVMVGLAGEQSGDHPPKSHQHLSLYVDRGEGIEPVRAQSDGFHAEFPVERAATFIFYVISRYPGQTGSYTLVIGAQTAKEPEPVYYHMIFEKTLAADFKYTRPLQVKEMGPPIRVRVDTNGFKPTLETLRFEAGSNSTITYPHAFKEGPSFASSIIDTLGTAQWEIVVRNRSTQAGSFRLVIEHPSPWRKE